MVQRARDLVGHPISDDKPDDEDSRSPEPDCTRDKRDESSARGSCRWSADTEGGRDSDRNSKRKRDYRPGLVPSGPVAPVHRVVHHQGESTGQCREHENDNRCSPKTQEIFTLRRPSGPHKAGKEQRRIEVCRGSVRRLGACSSAGERPLHTREVTGSIPVTPIPITPIPIHAESDSSGLVRRASPTRRPTGDQGIEAPSSWDARSASRRRFLGLAEDHPQPPVSSNAPSSTAVSFAANPGLGSL